MTFKDNTTEGPVVYVELDYWGVPICVSTEEIPEHDDNDVYCLPLFDPDQQTDNEKREFMKQYVLNYTRSAGADDYTGDGAAAQALRAWNYIAEKTGG